MDPGGILESRGIPVNHRLGYADAQVTWERFERPEIFPDDPGFPGGQPEIDPLASLGDLDDLDQMTNGLQIPAIMPAEIRI